MSKRTFRSRVAGTLVSGAACVFGGCTGDAGTGLEDSRVRWIEVVPASHVVALGTEIPFTSRATDRSGTVLAIAAFDWTSSAPHVVDVRTPDGTGTVLDFGAATVTATAERRSGAAILVATPDASSESARIEVVSRADAISAAVLGMGPLVAQGSYYGCSYPGLWTSFPRGTSVTVRVSSTVPADAIDAIRLAIVQVPVVTGGALDATFALTNEPHPSPGKDEVTVTADWSPTSQGCARDIGCTMHQFRKPGVLRSSRVVLPPIQTPNAFVHDGVGHGILGMCHLRPAGIGRPQNSLMSNGNGMNSSQISLDLTQLDIELERAVWGSSLNPGADVDAFRKVRLIQP